MSITQYALLSLAAWVGAAGCTRSGYLITGEAERSERGRMVAAGGATGSLARAGAGPFFEAQPLCTPGDDVALQVEHRVMGGEHFLVRCGASEPLTDDESLRIPIDSAALTSATSSSECFVLKPEEEARLGDDGVPSRVQLCDRSERPRLISRLFRRRVGQPFRVAAALATTGLRSRIKVLSHSEVEDGQRWEFVVRTDSGQRVAFRYELLEGRPLPLRIGSTNRLHFSPPSEEARNGHGGVLIMKDPSGQLLFALNAGLRVPVELLDGLEVSADRRVAYKSFHIDSRSCRTLTEHRQLRVRSGPDSQLFLPGTVSWLSHQGESFRFLALDAEVQMPSECSTMNLERVRWALTLGGSDQEPSR